MFGEAEPKFTIFVKNESELPQARAALDAAVAEWNSKTSVTRTEFKVLTTAEELNLMPHLTVKENELYGCGALGGSTLYFKRNDIRDLANRNPSYAQFSFAHELGHFLGLAEAGNVWSPPNPPSIMNQFIGESGETCANSMGSTNPPTQSIQSNDATMAKGCSAAARNAHNFPAPPTTEYHVDPYEPWFVDVWQRTETYYCVDNTCILTNVTYTYMGRQYY